MNDPKEMQKLIAALDSLFSAGFPASQIERTAQRLGVSWEPGLLGLKTPEST